MNDAPEQQSPEPRRDEIEEIIALFEVRKKYLSRKRRLQFQQDIENIKSAVESGDEEQIESGRRQIAELKNKLLSARRKRVLSDLLQVIAIALAITLVARTFIVEPHRIYGISMKPILHDNDRILFWKGVYGIRNPFAESYIITYGKPRRWDVVVFTSKGISGISERYRGKDFIKRVIGLPGEHVQILDSEVLIDGVALQKPESLGHLKYYREVVEEYPFVDVVVPRGCFYVLGDNSYLSEDSRQWGFVPLKNIKGKAFLILFPIDRLGTLQ